MAAAFQPLLPPHTIPPPNPLERKPIRFPRKNGSVSALLRDTISLTSWLLLGALLQGIGCLILGPRAILPTILTLAYRLTDHLLMTFNLTRNRYLDNVLLTKGSPQLPFPNGTFGAEPSRDQIVVFHLGVRSHHPLGFLAPGMKGIVDSFDRMMREMHADPETAGLLGLSTFLKQEQAAGNELLNIFYLRDYKALHRFAYGDSHMKGVKYFRKITETCPHIGIFHETFVVPRGHWEAIYINSEPTGLGDTWFPVRSGDGREEEKSQVEVEVEVAEKEKQKDKEENGERVFIRPLVEAGTGILRSKTGRLSVERMEEMRQYDEMIGNMKI
ncbi:hypothetical protein POX_c04660 [Penicillium oxalicum]|uniref:hypothetical protein n=1 Tax=Penicillium oxalicum TaxID=69781 RepID=UPI0020B8407B|nr:hypothetical protein POX_c04660 [Penicillium oxalicum]KAI2791781.1 hypothetical protein POX_c04660 [Penicillium oxalicum]